MPPVGGRLGSRAVWKFGTGAAKQALRTTRLVVEQIISGRVGDNDRRVDLTQQFDRFPDGWRIVGDLQVAAVKAGIAGANS